MTMISIIVLDFIHILVPFLVYLFYIAYKNSFDDKENRLALIITIFSALYIILKYNVPVFEGIPMFLVCLPLLISYCKKNDVAIIISSLAAIFYYFNFYDGYGFIIVFWFFLYFIIYKFFFERLKIWQFVSLFTLILVVVNMVITSFIIYSHNLLDFYFKIFFVGLLFLCVSITVIHLLARIEEVLNVRITVKEIEHDKQIKTTLFQITHEIKNPIAVCKGYLDMFDVNDLNHSKNYIPIIKEEIEKTLFLLEDFLSMNKVKINKELLDVNYLLSNFVENYKPYFKENKIRTSIKLTDNEVYLEGDYNRLFQVLTNVLKNSLEALENNPKIEKIGRASCRERV